MHKKPTGEERIYIRRDIHNIISNIYRMRLEDFCYFFTDLDICCLWPSFLDGEEPCKWKSTMFEGRWVSQVTAGGCKDYKGNYKETSGTTDTKHRVLQTVDEASCTSSSGRCKKEITEKMICSLLVNQNNPFFLSLP